MSQAPDPLDAELSALRPRGISPDLRARVADRLDRTPASRRWVWGVALAAVLAAAGGFVLVASWRQDPAPPDPSRTNPAPAAVIESEDAVPALAAYRRALARSPEDLDALLDRSAAAVSNTEPAPTSVGSYPRFGMILDPLLGDD